MLPLIYITIQEDHYWANLSVLGVILGVSYHLKNLFEKRGQAE